MRIDKNSLDSYIMENADKKTFVEMSKELGVCRPTIYAACRRLGIKPVNRKAQLDKIVLENYKEKTAAELAQMCKVPIGKVYYSLLTLGVEPRKATRGRRAKPFMERNEIIRFLIDSGFSHKNVSEAFGISRQRIDQIIHRDEQKGADMIGANNKDRAVNGCADSGKGEN